MAKSYYSEQMQKKNDDAYKSLMSLVDVIAHLNYKERVEIEYNVDTYDNRELSDFTITIKGKIK